MRRNIDECLTPLEWDGQLADVVKQHIKDGKKVAWFTESCVVALHGSETIAWTPDLPDTTYNTMDHTTFENGASFRVYASSKLRGFHCDVCILPSKACSSDLFFDIVIPLTNITTNPVVFYACDEATFKVGLLDLAV